MTDTLRDQLVAAFRAAAYNCPGDCGKTETECLDKHPIQVEVLHFDQVAVIAGPVEALADVALAVVCAEPGPFQRAHAAETMLAAVREHLELGDDDGVRTREHLLGVLDRAGVPSAFVEVPDEADDHSYRDMVNAPLSPETIKALRERLASGDYPVRKVRPRDVAPAREMTVAEAAVILPKVAVEDIDTTGCDCGHEGMGAAWHRDWCAWRKTTGASASAEGPVPSS